MNEQNNDLNQLNGGSNYNSQPNNLQPSNVSTQPTQQPPIMENINTISPQVIPQPENNVEAENITPVELTPQNTPVTPIAPTQPAVQEANINQATTLQPTTTLTPENPNVVTPEPSIPPSTPVTPAQPEPSLSNIPPNTTFGPSSPINPNNDLTQVGFVASSEPLPKKKNKKIKFIIILSILIILGLIGYFVVYPYVKKNFLDDPKNVYTATIENVTKNINSSINDLVHNKAIYDLNLSLESNIELLKPYSGYKYGVNLGLDPNTKNAQFGFSLTDPTNIEYSSYSYIKNDNAYVRYSTYRDDNGRIGLIHTGAVNTTETDNIFTIFQSLLNDTKDLNNEDLNYLTNKISTLIIDSIDESQLSKEDASITINDETLKVTNNKYVFDYNNYVRTMKFISEGLISDDKTIDILANIFKSEKETIKNDLTFKEDSNITEEAKKTVLYFSIYTYGNKNDIIGYSIKDSNNKFELNYYFKNNNTFDIYCTLVSEDIETGKEIANTIEAKGVKENNNTIVNIKYNENEIIILNISKLEQNNIELKYTLKSEDGDITGNVKYTKETTDKNLQATLDFSVESKDEYININLSFNEDWNSEVANINTNTAIEKTDEELNLIEQQFQSDLMNTSLGTLFKTISGMYSPEINDYYNNEYFNDEEEPSSDNPLNGEIITDETTPNTSVSPNIDFNLNNDVDPNSVIIGAPQN